MYVKLTIRIAIVIANGARFLSLINQDFLDLKRHLPPKVHTKVIHPKYIL